MSEQPPLGPPSFGPNEGPPVLPLESAGPPDSSAAPSRPGVPGSGVSGSGVPGSGVSGSGVPDSGVSGSGVSGALSGSSSPPPFPGPPPLLVDGPAISEDRLDRPAAGPGPAPIEAAEVPLTANDYGYDPGPHHRRGLDRRPWWGIGDVLLMIPIMVGVLLVSFGVMAALAVVEGVDLFAGTGSDPADLPASMLVIPTLIQQASWFGWPYLVSRWKGLGPVRDWGWAFKPVDLAIGFGTAFIAIFAAAVVGAGLGGLVGLEDESLAENTQVITRLEGSPWLYGLLFVVVVGAPLSEEVLFRGLILRSFQKRWGSVAGVAASVLLFVPLHIADGGFLTSGQVVLWGSIATLGAILSVCAVLSNRLAGPIIAHVLINAIGSAGALGWFDGLFEGLPS